MSEEFDEDLEAGFERQKKDRNAEQTARLIQLTRTPDIPLASAGGGGASAAGGGASAAGGGGGPDPKDYPGLFSDDEDEDEIDPELFKQFFGEDEDEDEDEDDGEKKTPPRNSFVLHIIAHGVLLIPQHIQLNTPEDIEDFINSQKQKLKNDGMLSFSNILTSAVAPPGNPTITGGPPLCPCNRAMLAYVFETICSQANKHIHPNMTIEDYINYVVSSFKDFWRKKGYISRQLTKRYYNDNPKDRHLFAVNRLRDLYKLIKTPTKVFVFGTNSANDGIERLKSDLNLTAEDRYLLRDADYCENTINHPNYNDRFSCAEILSFYLDGDLFKFKRMFNLNEFSDLQNIFQLLECVTNPLIIMPPQFTLDFSNAVKQMYGLFNKSQIVTDDYRLDCKYKTVNGRAFITQTNTLALNIQSRMLLHYVKSKLADPTLQYDDLPYLDSFEGIKSELGIMDVTGFWLDESCSVPHVPKTSTIDPRLLYNLGKSLEASAESLSSQPLSEYGNSSQPSQPIYDEPVAQVAAPKTEAEVAAELVAEVAETMTPEELDVLLNLPNFVRETDQESRTQRFSKGISFVPRVSGGGDDEIEYDEREDDNGEKYSRRNDLMPKGGSKTRRKKSKKSKKAKKTKTKKSKTKKTRRKKTKSKKTRKR